MPSPWDWLRYLETEPAARKFLIKSYDAMKIEHPERLSFQQSSRFSYTWRQARAFYDAADQCDLLVRPTLLFYGCTHLLKGYLITRDPYYPRTSRMLQHGVTTRKMKKSPYQLLADEIRPQKEGLFSHLAKIIGDFPLQNRYSVSQLFSYVPELREECKLVLGYTSWQSVIRQNQSLLAFPSVPQGTLGFSLETFLDFLNRLAPAGIRFFPAEGSSAADAKLVGVSAAKGCLLDQHPLFAEAESELCFWSGEEPFPLPKWAVHYMLLYMLSMLSRYETESWGELILSHTLSEVYLVDRFLDIHQRVFPGYIHRMLDCAWSG
ncbi:YaaC family protein [Brevibacillus sp. B_LB10_24]|uniref:YaaC family protein n=1 Tax=Brevibacillus sp. B_LB10_24 TaxID=3380645 RepID=UPI0038B81E0A